MVALFFMWPPVRFLQSAEVQARRPAPMTDLLAIYCKTNTYDLSVAIILFESVNNPNADCMLLHTISADKMV